MDATAVKPKRFINREEKLSPDRCVWLSSRAPDSLVIEKKRNLSELNRIITFHPQHSTSAMTNRPDADRSTENIPAESDGSQPPLQAQDDLDDTAASEMSSSLESKLSLLEGSSTGVKVSSSWETEEEMAPPSNDARKKIRLEQAAVDVPTTTMSIE